MKRWLVHYGLPFSLGFSFAYLFLTFVAAILLALERVFV